jgi:putative FmdB family regulatory protein
MPIYLYKCEHCDSASEFRMKMSDPHPTVCPKCNKEGGMMKILAPTGFKLEGGGWFSQGYVGGGQKQSNNNEY